MAEPTTPSLPFHFIWDGHVATTTLVQTLEVLSTRPELATAHLSAGHVQTALRTQGYAVLAEGISGPTDLPLLIQKLRVALDLHESWWKSRDAEADDLGRTMSNLARIFQRKGSALLQTSYDNVKSWRSWLADALRPKD